MPEFTDATEFERAVFTEHPTETCNGFAFDYARDHDAVVHVGETETGDLHCWVFDRERQQIIDPMLRQFRGLVAGYWDADDGTQHPHAESFEQYTADQQAAFTEKYDGAYSPFIV